MEGKRYTLEQLKRLQQSPLVRKPDGLPSIEQWLDVAGEQGNNNTNGTGTSRRPRAVARDSDASAAAEHRPILNPMGQFGRRQSTRKFQIIRGGVFLLVLVLMCAETGEDPVLAPPKFNFASATRTAKAGQSKDAIASPSEIEQSGERLPRERGERWRDSRDAERTREKAYTNGRRSGREEAEGWAVGKGRKSLGQEDFDKGFGRTGDRERKEADADAQDGSRRAIGGRWLRRDENAKEADGPRLGASTSGGWRDRERNREREKDREWGRGAREDDPEWMEAAAPKKEPKVHTQEDFQRWKEQMKAKDTPAEEKEESHVLRTSTEGVPQSSSSLSALNKPAITPSPLEPNLGSLFGNWGKEKAIDTHQADGGQAKGRTDKKSRFMNMFAKPEEPSGAAEVPAAAATPALPGLAGQGNADKEGFERILKMLGGAQLGGGLGTQPNAPSNETQGLLDFLKQSGPAEPLERRTPAQQNTRTTEPQAHLEHITAPRSLAEARSPPHARFSSTSAEDALLDTFATARPDSNRLSQDYVTQQPAQRQHTPQDASLATILNSRTRDNASRGHDGKQAERDFLLTLMQQPRNTPPHMLSQNAPRPSEGQNFAFFDQPQHHQQAPQKPRAGPPPGFLEDQRLYDGEMMRREAERREQMQQIRELQQQEAQRNKLRGMPMGFPGLDDPALNLQRRNTAGEIPRQMTNMGIPSQPIPDVSYLGGRQLPSQQDRPNIPPPPGFGGHLRQPPGLGAHNQPPQMGPGPSFSAGNTPLGHPPGFPPASGSNMPRGMFPPGGGGGGVGGPGNNGTQAGLPPQGYFPPPGYGPMMGMRGEDPRMLFEQQQQQQHQQPFGGLAPGPGLRAQQQQGRQGPLPPGMY